MFNDTDLPEHGRSTSYSRLLWLFVMLGIFPLVVLAFALLIGGNGSVVARPAIDGMKTFSAIIISFLGGTHSGILLAGEFFKGTIPTTSTREFPFWPFALAMIAPFFGWIAIFLNEPMSFALLIVCFLAQGAWDAFNNHTDPFPRWYAKMRLLVTMISVVSLVVAMFVTA